MSIRPWVNALRFLVYLWLAAFLVGSTVGVFAVGFRWMAGG